MKNKKQTVGFIRLIFSSFFRWWWAVITGFASIASWLFVSREGILLTPLMFSLLILLGLSLLFLVLSTVYQGWLIYQKHFTSPRIVGFPKGDFYGSDHVFLLESDTDIAQGTVIELKRFYDGVEVAIALVEIVEKNSKGQYQANPVWFSPGHLRDLRMGQFGYPELDAELSVKLRTLQKAKKQIADYTKGDTFE